MPPVTNTLRGLQRIMAWMILPMLAASGLAESTWYVYPPPAPGYDGMYSYPQANPTVIIPPPVVPVYPSYPSYYPAPQAPMGVMDSLAMGLMNLFGQPPQQPVVVPYPVYYLYPDPNDSWEIYVPPPPVQPLPTSAGPPEAVPDRLQQTAQIGPPPDAAPVMPMEQASPTVMDSPPVSVVPPMEHPVAPPASDALTIAPVDTAPPMAPAVSVPATETKTSPPRQPPAAKPAPSAQKTGRFAILAGSFLEDNLAELSERYIRELGYPSYRQTLEVNNKKFTRIYVGPFAEKSEATRASKRMQAQYNMPGVVVPYRP